MEDTFALREGNRDGDLGKRKLLTEVLDQLV